MVNYELLNQVLVLARAIEICSLLAAYAFAAHTLQKAVYEVVQMVKSRKKKLDNKDNK